MQAEHALPFSPTAPRERVIVVEGRRGRERSRVLERWVAQAAREGVPALLLPCDLNATGMWAGVSTLIASVFPALRQADPTVLERNAIELAAVVPALMLRSAPVKSLTDTSEGVEAVRNYAVDRAYRIPHGLVDVLDALFHAAPDALPRVLVCDDFECAGSLGRRFFHELMRRRGEAFGLTLVLVVEPGTEDAALEPLRLGADARRVRLDVRADAAAERSPAQATILAQELERQVKGDFETMESRLPELIRLWRESEHPENAYQWEAFALGRFNHRGFYEDALAYADPVLEHLDVTATGDGYFTRTNLVGSIFGCLVAAGQAGRAHQVVKEHGYDRIDEPTDRARICYIMAMLHARFLPERDLAQAEAYIVEGLRLLERPDVRPENRDFLQVFLNNGLALVRHRQGRAEEAVTLCREGIAHLDEHMVEDRHKLHRSVLLYNIAQVYTATRDYERALEYFAAAMRLDPNYSEYFNERGNVYLKLGRHDEAIRDYHEAMRLSPPYHEVWTNLGQCLRRLGRLDDAERAYARAIDLDPSV
ncbi:MAG TPA: tetratricopeptide repeat protein, partial [Longimicrobium sp.]|nr:tetratricopeptide repeat protein [Longimicrobium sp.]